MSAFFAAVCKHVTTALWLLIGSIVFALSHIHSVMGGAWKMALWVRMNVVETPALFFKTCETIYFGYQAIVLLVHAALTGQAGNVVHVHLPLLLLAASIYVAWKWGVGLHYRGLHPRRPYSVVFFTDFILYVLCIVGFAFSYLTDNRAVALMLWLTLPFVYPYSTAETNHEVRLAEFIKRLDKHYLQTGHRHTPDVFEQVKAEYANQNTSSIPNPMLSRITASDAVVISYLQWVDINSIDMGHVFERLWEVLPNFDFTGVLRDLEKPQTLTNAERGIFKALVNARFVEEEGHPVAGKDKQRRKLRWVQLHSGDARDRAETAASANQYHYNVNGMLVAEGSDDENPNEFQDRGDVQAQMRARSTAITAARNAPTGALALSKLKKKPKATVPPVVEAAPQLAMPLWSGSDTEEVELTPGEIEMMVRALEFQKRAQHDKKKVSSAYMRELETLFDEFNSRRQEILGSKQESEWVAKRKAEQGEERFMERLTEVLVAKLASQEAMRHSLSFRNLAEKPAVRFAERCYKVGEDHSERRDEVAAINVRTKEAAKALRATVDRKPAGPAKQESQVGELRQANAKICILAEQDGEVIAQGYVCKLGAACFAVLPKHALRNQKPFNVHTVDGKVVTVTMQMVKEPLAYPDVLLCSLGSAVAGFEACTYAKKEPQAGEQLVACTLGFTPDKKVSVKTMIAGIYAGRGVATFEGTPYHNCGAVNWSTYPGNCRMAVFNAQGHVLGGHRWSECVVQGKLLPAFEFDIPNFEVQGEKLPGLVSAGTKPVVVGAQEAGKPQMAKPRYVKATDLVANSQQQGPKLKRGLELIGDSSTHAIAHKIGPVVWEDNVELRARFPDVDVRTVVYKPGENMIEKEIAEFEDHEITASFMKKVRLVMGYLAACDADTAVEMPVDLFEENAVNVQNMTEVISCMNMDANAGYPFAYNVTLREAVECYTAEALAKETLEVMRSICVGENPELPYMTFGKKDKYSCAKAEAQKGRSIQNPPFYLKAVWLYVFGVSDAAWTEKCARAEISEMVLHNGKGGEFSDRYANIRYWTGINNLLPVDELRKEVALESIACFSTDITSWDRRLPAQVMEVFFRDYIARMANVPKNLLEFIISNTICSRLITRKGLVWQKFAGNPSGFPATLRLNSVCNAALSIAAMMEALELPLEAVLECFHFEFCGDDVRCWVGQNIERNSVKECVGRYLQVWQKELPWVVKLEGVYYGDEHPENSVECRMSPPNFVGNTYFCVGPEMYYVVTSAAKLSSKLAYRPNGETAEEFDERLLGTFVALARNVWLHCKGYLCDSHIKTLCEMWPKIFNLQRANAALSTTSKAFEMGW